MTSGAQRISWASRPLAQKACHAPAITHANTKERGTTCAPFSGAQLMRWDRAAHADAVTRVKQTRHAQNCTATSTVAKRVTRTRSHQSPKNLSQPTTQSTPSLATRWWLSPHARMVLRPSLGVSKLRTTLEVHIDDGRDIATALNEPSATCEHVLGGPAGAQQSEQCVRHGRRTEGETMFNTS